MMIRNSRGQFVKNDNPLAVITRLNLLRQEQRAAGNAARKTAEAVACALNNAYNRGLTDNQGELTMEFWLLLQHWLLIQIAPGAYWSRFVWALYHYANAWSYQNTKWCQWAVYAKQHMLAYSCS
jgi:hypothetical protein